MTTAQMKRITTNAGDTISIEADTDAATIAILKAAPVTRFSEFVYTGNSSAGQNSGNYEDLEAFFRAAGLVILSESDDEIGPIDDVDVLIYNLERQTGISAIRHRGKTMRYHVQARQGESHREFGYTWRADYRLIGVE